MTGHSTQDHGLVDKVEISHRMDLMISEFFPELFTSFCVLVFLTQGLFIDSLVRKPRIQVKADLKEDRNQNDFGSRFLLCPV